MLGRFQLLSLFNACQDTYQLQPVKVYKTEKEKCELLDENPIMRKGMEYMNNKRNPSDQFADWEREEESINREMKDTINFDKSAPTESGDLVFG